MENKVNTRYLTQLGLLSGIVILMAFTPLGYLKVGVVDITFIVIPVAVGAIILGPKAGAILGGVFGLTSFAQCFGMSAFGTMLFGINPIGLFIMCVIPRILVGFLSGLLFKWLYNKKRTRVISFAIGSVSAALINTILYISFFAVLFHETGQQMATESGLNFFPFLLTFVSINSIIEMIACLIIGTAITKSVFKVTRRYDTSTVEQRG